MTEDIVERVARGVHEHLSRRNIMQYLDNEEDCKGVAQAALAAIRETHAILPKEPTEAMVKKGREVFSRSLTSATSVYSAMIAAAEGSIVIPMDPEAAEGEG